MAHIFASSPERLNMQFERCARQLPGDLHITNARPQYTRVKRALTIVILQYNVITDGDCSLNY